MIGSAIDRWSRPDLTSVHNSNLDLTRPLTLSTESDTGRNRSQIKLSQRDDVSAIGTDVSAFP